MHLNSTQPKSRRNNSANHCKRLKKETSRWRSTLTQSWRFGLDMSRLFTRETMRYSSMNSPSKISCNTSSRQASLWIATKHDKPLNKRSALLFKTRIWSPTKNFLKSSAVACSNKHWSVLLRRSRGRWVTSPKNWRTGHLNKRWICINATRWLQVWWCLEQASTWRPSNYSTILAHTKKVWVLLTCTTRADRPIWSS